LNGQIHTMHTHTHAKQGGGAHLSASGKGTREASTSTPDVSVISW